MKIAIITSTFPPYAGGIGNVALSNARELKQLGHEVTVFTPLYEPVTEEATDIKVVRIKPLFKYGNSAFVPKLRKMLKGFEIVYLHYPFFGGAEVIALGYSLQPTAYSLFLHYHMDVVGSGILKMIFTLHNKFILPRIIKKAHKVIVTSMDYGKNSNLAKFMEKNPEKFIEVPNGVNTQIFQPSEKDRGLLAKHNIDISDKVVLFVGGLDKAHYFKGVEYLIEAMSRLQQADYSWKLLIVGKGELQDEYFSLADQLRIESKVVFTGYVPNEDLPKYYNLADVVVLPSIDKSEAFGLALVEAMACAKPVIASNLAGVRSVVDENNNGLLCEPKNADDLATKINHLLSNPEQTKKFGQAGLLKARSKYDWRTIREKLADLMAAD